jgi:hypothetical protein
MKFRIARAGIVCFPDCYVPRTPPGSPAGRGIPRARAYGVAGLLVADIDLAAATALLASRCRG